MTISAGEFLGPSVFRVAEAHAKCWTRFGCAGITAELVASTARRNIAVAGFRTRRVTGEASRVGIEAGRNRQCDSSARRAMASRTRSAARLHVGRVIEVDAKTRQPRKRFNRAGIYVSVTNRADRTFLVRELLRVAPDAGSVAGGAWQSRP